MVTKSNFQAIIFRNRWFTCLTSMWFLMWVVIVLSQPAAVAAAGAAPVPVKASGSNEPPQEAQASDPATCKGILQQPAALKNALLGVPKYQSTYIIVLSGTAKDKITSPTPAALANLPIEIIDEPETNSIVQDLHLQNVHRVPASETSPVQPLVDMSSGKTEAVIMWGPLAGAGVIDLALDDKVSEFSIDRPKDPPAIYAGGTSTAVPCSAAIADDLDSFGVLPAELLVPVNLRSMLNTPTPIFSMQNAEKGQVIFQQVCSRCHGQYAVRDPALAPVDLRKSIRRFQFIGFKYIVMNGRSQKGMPPLRGTLTQDQIALVYQYLVARSKHLLMAGPK